MWTRWARSRRDPAQARFLTLASLRWVLRHRAYTPWYLVRYWRLLKFRLLNPHVVLRGMVFFGKRVDVMARPGYGRLEIDLTIDDAKAYTKPWTVRVNWRLAAGDQLIEFICNENERSSKHYVR